jgi:superfamily II DNA or RNA helicase
LGRVEYSLLGKDGTDLKALRRWQKEAFDSWAAGVDGRIKSDFLLVATPGGGKTRVACEIGTFALTSRLIDQIIIVVPTTNLQRSFARDLHECGVEVDDRSSRAHLAALARNAAPGRSCFGELIDGRLIQGCVATYQQVCSSPELFERLMRARTLVVLDEIHHAADQKYWGAALKRAFGKATHRLIMSGTPFRSDNQSLPFIQYAQAVDRKGLPVSSAVIDYEYSYSTALDERVVRPIAFPSMDGHVRWISAAGVEYERAIKEKLDPKSTGERLRTFLRSADAMREMISRANDKLQFLRSANGGHRDAAALLIAIDQQHARQMAILVREIAGYTPALVVSEESESDAIIERFRKSSEPWIVAVRKVSEGTDIPRLRVLVYATNWKTEMFFRQACGRVVRLIGELKADQQAYVYILADPDFIEYAREFREAVEAYLRLQQEKQGVLTGLGDPGVSLYEGLEAVAIEDVTIEGQHDIEPLVLTEAREILQQLNLTTDISEVQFAKALSLGLERQGHAGGLFGSSVAKPARRRDLRIRGDELPSDQREKLRAQINKLVSRISGMTRSEPKDVRYSLLKRFGSVESLDVAKLNAQASYLRDWLRSGVRPV